MKAETIREFTCPRRPMTRMDAAVFGAAVGALAMMLLLLPPMERQRRNYRDMLAEEQAYADRQYEAGYAAGLAAGEARQD